MLKGSCLCQSIQIAIHGELGPVSHCHCKTCQKSHAAAFGTVARVKTADFTIEAGKDLLTSFRASEHKIRYFCSQCGSQIYAEFEGQDESVMRIAIFDGELNQKPIRHIFVSEKAPWFEITDQLPQFDQWPN